MFDMNEYVCIYENTEYSRAKAMKNYDHLTDLYNCI